MKIAFVGDSFCTDVNRYFNSDEIKNRPSWLTFQEIVAQHYNAEIIMKGERGIALFHSYEDLLKIIDDADYIILFITKEFRLPNMHRAPITPTTYKSLCADQLPVLEKKLSIAVAHYYENVISLDFHTLVHRLLIQEIDRLMIEKKKKCIWFFVRFDNFDYTDAYQFKWINSGPVGSHLLDDLSLYELSSRNIIDTTKDYAVSNYFAKYDYHQRLNHFGQETNQKFANLLIDRIDADNFTPGLLSMGSYFNGLTEWRK